MIKQNLNPRLILYILLFLFALITNACGTNNSESTVTPEPIPSPEWISIDGAEIIGIFNQAISKDLISGRLWMSYSSVYPSSYFPTVAQFDIGIRLSYSDDNGNAWTDTGKAPVTN